MVRPDWGALDRPSHAPGVYKVTVGECKEKLSQKGDHMLNLRLDVDVIGKDPACLCYENLMLTGKGASIGLAKLLAFGFMKGDDIRPEELLGRRAWVRVSNEEYNGKQRLKVSTTFDPFECGFWPEDAPPEGVDAAPTASIEDDGVPF